MPSRARTTTIAGWLQVGLSIGWGLFAISLVLTGLALAGAFGQMGAEIQNTVDNGGAAGMFLLPLMLGFGAFGWIIGFAAAMVIILGLLMTGWSVFMLLLGVGVLRRSRVAGIATLLFSLLYTLFAFGAVFGGPAQSDNFPEGFGDDFPELSEQGQPEQFMVGGDMFSDDFITVTEASEANTQPSSRQSNEPQDDSDARGKGVAVLWLLAQLALLGTLAHPDTRKDLVAAAAAKQNAEAD